MRPIHSQDKYKRTPAMFAIRNHNNDFLFKILEEGCKIDKLDSSQNSLLHYAAAYGNIEAIVFLKAQNVMQTKNKK
jgi:ankyrin repeat protein